jgi:FtsP/CotA-like multicopper oxidase with cupredoxin domain
MSIRKLLNILVSILMVTTILLGGTFQASAQGEDPPPPPLTDPDPGVVTQTEREAAAALNAAEGLAMPETTMTEMTPSQVPHYFSSPNYANSPLPRVEGAVITVGNPLIDRQYATGFAVPQGQLGPVLVINSTSPLPQGLVKSFEVWNQTDPGDSPSGSAGHVFHAYVLHPTGNANEYSVVYDSGLLTIPPATDPAGNVVSFAVPDIGVQAGDVIAYYGQGIPVDVGQGSDVRSYPTLKQPMQGETILLGGADYPIVNEQRISSFAATVLDLSGNNVVVTGGLRKFVDGLPGLGPDKANNLGQYIPIAVPDTQSYPGSDYYEIELVQYQEQMHSDLPPTTLRGYRQANMGGSPAHYLGPLIIATKDRPVRILFRNLLPAGEEGNLFIPVDTTVMGSGMGANMFSMHEHDPQNPMCGQIPKPYNCYTENRATLHLHGGITPWISDGTPHQWITPANENTPYPKGVSVQNVPDMPDPGLGAQTFFYTNQQSARLMFYHDHAWGITRLNVYAGEAAGYIITDESEQKLIEDGIIPDEQIPLIIQDKTFVPSMDQLMWQDPTWDVNRWGGEGNLWLPHVYSPAQNPGDSSGVNQYGRWAYGPWFWPPTSGVEHGPIPNPYYDPNCDPDAGWCEPEMMPGVPSVSMGMESFHDTPLVNGTAYPTVTLQPKSYRFRILNAANDRFFNLSLYKADATGTEVALNPDEVAAALEDTTIFPTPVEGTEGPDWIQIGTEGGFLPAPVVIPAHPTTWVNDPTVFNAGNIDQHSLLVAPAERADVIVDFSAYAGQTLILYNDAPAAFPARDPRYDYYTGNADLRDTGGAPSTLPGYGPNTRTIMQIKIAAEPAAPAFNLNALKSAFAHKADGSGVFEFSQHPIIVGQGAYNSAYGTSFQNSGPNAGLVQIYNTSFSFKTLVGGASGPSMTMPLQPKQIQDEMGEAFEQEYGRMSGFLGLETPNAQAGLQNMLLYPYTHPPTEILDGIESAPGVDITPIAVADDGTQIWKITHNGVDTHPIHFHLYDVQLINRVGWDGIIRKPDLNELGWKDTVRVSPLEDTIVALRPIVPHVPFDLPNSIRLLDPSMPDGAELANTTMAEQMGLAPFAFAPNGEPIDIVNHIVNFGWEYVWHCHILSHEEMDMMRSVAVAVVPRVPTDLVVTISGTGNNRRADLSWVDGSMNETGFIVQRATSANGPWTTIATLNHELTSPAGPDAGDTISYSDLIGIANEAYFYRVLASNTVGDTWDYSDPNLNEGALFPTVTKYSEFSNIVSIDAPPAVPPAAPTGLTAALVTGPQVKLDWADNSDNESGFTIERAVVTGGVPGPFEPIDGVGLDITTYNDPDVMPNTTYAYRVLAYNGNLQSPVSNQVTITVLQAPAPPTNLVTTVQGALPPTGPRVRLVFRDNQNGVNPETGFQVFRSDNGGAFSLLTTLGPRTGVGGVTYFDYNVVGGNSYSYYVVTVRNTVPSQPSNTALASLPPVPAAPDSFTGTTRITNNTPRIDLAWTDSSNNESRFVIQRATDAAFTANLVTYNRGANTSNWSQNGLPFGVTYYYRIAALNLYGQSAWVNLNPFPITTPATPPAPAAPATFTGTTTLTNGGTQVRINLNWTDSSNNETRFVIQRATNAAFTANVVTFNRGANSSSYANTNLPRGITYYYRIRAENLYGQSAWVLLIPFPITTP